MTEVAHATLAILLVTTTACAPGARRATRELLDGGDIEAAVRAAGDDSGALGEVSLEVLARAFEDPSTREAAARGLRAAGTLSRSTLRRLSSSGLPAISAVADEVLASQGDRRALDRLAHLLDHPDGEVRAAAVRGLARSHGTASFFEPFLRDTDSRVRLSAVEGLARLQDARTAPLIVDLARHDPSPSVRAAALRALRRSASTEVLLEASRDGLNDPEILVRNSAIGLVAFVSDRESATALLRERMARGEPAEAIRAASVLARWGDAEARGVLTRTLAEGCVALAGAAAIGIAQVGRDMADVLIAALDRPEPEVRMQVAAALLDLGENARAESTLVALLERPGWIGIQAAAALVRTGHEGAAGRLEAGLGDDDEGIRALAASACGRTRGGERIARRALTDASANVRVAAAAAILERLVRGRNG